MNRPPQSLKEEAYKILLSYGLEVATITQSRIGDSDPYLKEALDKAAQNILSAIELRLPPRLENKIVGNTSIAHDPGFREGYNQALGEIKQLLLEKLLNDSDR